MKPLAPEASAGSRHLVQTLARGLAGVVASIVLIANIVSFAALMFAGPRAPGAATAIWALLIGSGIVGVWVAWKTSIPPLATGIDSPTGAVLVLLAATAGRALQAGGGGPADTIPAIMLRFTVATALSGALLWGIGLARWSAYLRFAPHFVVAGFLAATGWLLIAGGIRLTTGRPVSGLLSPWGSAEAAKLLCGVAVWALVLAQKRWVRWPLALPVTLLVLAAGGSLVLRLLGLSGPEQGWYLPSLGSLTPWRPLQALQASSLPPSLIASVAPEMVAVAIVALISLVTKTSSLEVTRKVAGDLDVEMRAHGVATLVSIPFGGLASSMLENAGGVAKGLEPG